MTVMSLPKDAQTLKQQRLLKAFEGVEYRFFADWSDADHLAQQLLGEEVNSIIH